VYHTFDWAVVARARWSDGNKVTAISAKEKMKKGRIKRAAASYEPRQHIIVIIIMAIEGERPDNNKRKYSSYAAALCCVETTPHCCCLEPSKGNRASGLMADK
jgi:hypothetical protein